MRTIYLFFSLLLSLAAFGQPAPINRRPFALSSLAQNNNPSPLSIPGLAYWWVASDLTNSFSVGDPVGTWTDRVHGVAWSGTTNKPILSGSNYLQFYRSNWLSIVPAVKYAPYGSGVNTNIGLCVIASHNQTLITGVFVDSTNTSFVLYAVTTPSSIWYSGVTIGDIAANHVYDFLACPYTNTFDCFTNGNFFANQPVNNLDAIGWLGIHWDKNLVEALQGKIYEVMVWTNRTGYWSSTDIATLHAYCTNVYGTNKIGPDGIYP